MSDSLDQVGTFNRIRWPQGAHKEEGCHWIGKMVEWYFDYGQSSYSVIHEESDDGIPTEKYEANRYLGRTILKVIGCALKALSLLTVLIPLVMLVGKIFYRADNIFVIKPKPAQQQAQDGGGNLQDPVTGPANPSIDGNSQVDDGGSGAYVPRHTSHVDTSSNVGGTSTTSKKSSEQIHQEFVFNELLSQETLDNKANTYDLQADEIVIQGFGDLERVRILYSQVNDQVSRIKRYRRNNSDFEDVIERFEGIQRKLKDKLKHDPTVLQIVTQLETEAKQNDDEENLINYVKAVGVFVDMTDFDIDDVTEDQVPDVAFYQQVKQRIQPTPIQNCGNSCYLNSDLQLILSIPAIKELLLGEFKQVPIRDREEGESVEKYQLFCESELRNFNITKEYLKEVKPAFQAFVAAVESKDQAEIDKAARNLRDATYDVGRKNLKDDESPIFKMIEDSGHGKYEQMQPEVFMNIMLNAAGYALRTRRHVYGDDEGKEELKVCSEATNETMIQLPLKESVGDEQPYAHTLQGLIDHQFSPMSVDVEDWKIEGKPVKKDVTLLQEAPEYLFVQVKRFATELDPETLNFKKYKLNNPVIFDNGEQVDFSKAMDKAVTESDEGPFLYEVVGAVQHHGGINGGHYTAMVKKGGEWQNCDDDSDVDTSFGKSYPAQEGGACSPNLEKGYLYAFRRIPKITQ